MRKYSVLIVDDEENVLKLLDKVIAKEGYHTYTASDASRAMELLMEHQIDLLITDIKMPGMSGIELLTRVREIDPMVNVIIMTAFATLETAIEALKNGARDYITKPFNLDEIVASINRITAFLEDKKGSDSTVERFMTSKSPRMLKVMELIRQVADSHATVMLYGETGTGKELAAQAIHSLSPRSEKPFIKVNCAAIPDQLLESELFGYDKGAFTGAVVKKPGRFELADKGSIFLDEIGDVSHAIQVKLLRVLQERELHHLGGTKTLKVDVRIVAATNKNMEELVRNKIIREDLYYRLNVVPITLPPLRERKEDIADLIEYFLTKSAQISGKPTKRITKDVLMRLTDYNWPGNIRELENIIERCVVVTQGELICVKDLPEYINSYEFKDIEELQSSESLDDALDNTEKEIIIKALRECKGNRTKASELLSISRRSLHRKIIKYDIED